MKKVKVYLMSALVGAALLQGCGSREVVAPTVTNANQHPNGLIQNRVIYSVHVISSSVDGNARQEGLNGAQVTVSQNGRASTKTVNENGIAIFDDLYDGDVTLFVKSEGHASVNIISSVNGQINVGGSNATGGNNSNQNVVYSASTLVTLPRLNGSAKGRFTIDSDKDPKTSPVPAANVKVRLTYSNTIEPNVFYTTTDADGIYTFTSVPGANATLSVESSFTLGTGGELQYFNIAVPNSLSSVAPKPATSGSVLDLGSYLLDSGSDRVLFTGAAKGLLFGDYNFLDKVALLNISDLGGNGVTPYNLGLVGINQITGNVLIAGSNGVFAPWITTPNFNTTSTGSLIGSTVSLSAGLSGDVVSESTLAGIVFATGIVVNGVGYVQGTNTIVGIVERSLASGTLTTSAGSNIDLDFFGAKAGFSTIDIINKNSAETGDNVAVSYILSNGSFVAANALPAVTNFITTDVKVKLTLNAPIAGYEGTEEFLATYDPANGQFSISTLPVPASGTATYDVVATVSKNYTRPDGYVQLVELKATFSVDVEDGVIKDAGPHELVYTAAP